MPALRVLVVALAGSKFLARSKLVSSRPSLSSGMTIVAFSLQTCTSTNEKRTQTQINKYSQQCEHSMQLKEFFFSLLQVKVMVLT